MNLGKELRTQSEKLLKAAEIVESEYDAKDWMPVPPKAIVITYEEFLSDCLKLIEDTPGGQATINMDALAHTLFGKAIDPDQWEYSRKNRTVNVKGPSRLDKIERPPRI